MSFESEQENIQYPEIAQELRAMAVEDQKLRNSVRKREDWDEDLDKRNTSRLKEIIAKIGWPTVSKVGERGSTDAWMIAQHADLEPSFQEECLNLMKENAGDVETKLVGYLEDRVRMNTGRPQLYGTQFPGSEPHPIEDPEHLDQRRKAMGMEPFSEYAERMQELNKEFEENKKPKQE